MTSRAKTTQVAQAMTIGRTPEDLYAVFQDASELAKALRHLHGRLEDEDTKQETQLAPIVQIVSQTPPVSIEWVAKVGEELRYRASAAFLRAPGDRGTEIHCTLEIMDTPGPVQKTLDRVRGREPKFLLREDLRNLKQLMETGEYPTTRGQPAGKRSFRGHTLMLALEERLQRELEQAEGRAKGAVPQAVQPRSIP